MFPVVLVAELFDSGRPIRNAVPTWKTTTVDRAEAEITVVASEFFRGCHSEHTYQDTVLLRFSG